MLFGEAESLARRCGATGTTASLAGHLPRCGTANGVDTRRSAGPEKGCARARAVLNLIVTVVDEAAADRVVHALIGLGVHHPSRAIVLVPQHGAPGAQIDARISTHCNDAIGGGDRICYEEVVLTVRGEAAEHLSGIVAPLLIHDLPTHIWWPGDPPFSDPVFDQLVEMGDRLIVDSSDFSDLLNGAARRSATTRGVGDLCVSACGWHDLTRSSSTPSLPALPAANLIRPGCATPSRRIDRRAGMTSRGALATAPMPRAALCRLTRPPLLAAHRTPRRFATGFDLRLAAATRWSTSTRPVSTDDVSQVSISVGLSSLARQERPISHRPHRDDRWSRRRGRQAALLRRVAMETPSESALLSAPLTMEPPTGLRESLRSAAISSPRARAAPLTVPVRP